MLLLVVAGFGLATVGFGLSTNVYLSLVCLFLTGAFDSISMVIRGTLEQMITPDHLRGRVLAVEYMFIGFSNELGAFESGAAAALFGPIIAVAGGGIGTILVVAIVALLWPALARIGPLHTLKPLESDPNDAGPPRERNRSPGPGLTWAGTSPGQACHGPGFPQDSPWRMSCIPVAGAARRRWRRSA